MVQHHRKAVRAAVAYRLYRAFRRFRDFVYIAIIVTAAGFANSCFGGSLGIRN